ncbi:hypothetical protein B1778_03495 [Dehalococcoides mccartyi]|uniref:hypothetical protein n=1 Tax=Dehalococcoides mccartyi TaxID=61435 RepID=UPI00098FFFF8|nr:hypothetical protein [Dehalococcoides mccartyi]AQU06600.1 hypothetical protein B1777_03680 [Dehalococcoides mccartyi]AQU08037.1 hypothetical protein B1778_03495 [Dehalococcoides mccartyi]
MSIDNQINQSATSFRFRPVYFMAPLMVLVISLLLTAVYYGRLPSDVAYRFSIDGAPVTYIDAGLITGVLLGVQLLLVLFAFGLAIFLPRLGFFKNNQTDFWVKPGTLLGFMGNIMAVPQLILAYALLDVFVYNVHQIHLLPLWLFAIILIVIAAIVIGIFAIPVFVRAYKTFNSPSASKKE